MAILEWERDRVVRVATRLRLRKDEVEDVDMDSTPPTPVAPRVRAVAGPLSETPRRTRATASEATPSTSTGSVLLKIPSRPPPTPSPQALQQPADDLPLFLPSASPSRAPTPPPAAFIPSVEYVGRLQAEFSQLHDQNKELVKELAEAKKTIDTFLGVIQAGDRRADEAETRLKAAEEREIRLLAKIEDLEREKDRQREDFTWERRAMRAEDEVDSESFLKIFGLTNNFSTRY
jgi:hypothetical protein